MSACNTLSDDGSTLTDGSVAGDWRLPNVKELQSLIHYGFDGPSLPDTAGTGQCSEGNPFARVQSSYWSSTANEISMDEAWDMGMGSGILSIAKMGDRLYAWPVRDGN